MIEIFYAVIHTREELRDTPDIPNFDKIMSMSSGYKKKNVIFHSTE